MDAPHTGSVKVVVIYCLLAALSLCPMKAVVHRALVTAAYAKYSLKCCGVANMARTSIFMVTWLVYWNAVT